MADPEITVEEEIALGQSLIDALEKDDLDAAAKAIAKGAPVNRALRSSSNGYHNMPPLAFAKSGRAVELLVGAGADADGALPIPGNDFTLDRPIVWAKNAEVATALLVFGADIKTPEKGRRALQGAMDAETVNALVNSGADIRYRDGDVKAILHYPLNRMGDPVSVEVTEALIKKGADVNATDAKDNSPLHYARSADNVYTLFASGARVRGTINAEGQTPLFNVAYALKDAQTIAALGNIGVDPKVLDKKGETALFEFARKAGVSEADSIKALLDVGVDPTVRNADGKRASNLAPDEKIKATLIEAERQWEKGMPKAKERPKSPMEQALQQYRDGVNPVAKAEDGVLEVPKTIALKSTDQSRLV